MVKKLRVAILATILLLVALSSVALAPPMHGSQELTPVVTLPALINPTATTPSQQDASPTPGKIKPIPLTAQAGNSDGIVVLGLLIVAIVIIPIVLKQKGWRGN